MVVELSAEELAVLRPALLQTYLVQINLEQEQVARAIPLHSAGPHVQQGLMVVCCWWLFYLTVKEMYLMYW